MSTIKVNRLENTDTTDGGINIDSSGRAGIGTAAPGTQLEIAGSASTLLRLDSSNGNGGVIRIRNGSADKHFFGSAADFMTGGTANQTAIRSNSDILFGISGNEKARLDSSGRLLLGTTTPGDGGADDLTISTANHTGISIKSGSSHSGGIYFGDGTSGASQYEGIIQYSHAINAFQFYTNYSVNSGASSMTLDSSGRLLVGSTSTSNTGLLCVKGNASSSTGAGQLTLQKGTGVTGADQELGAYNLGEGSASTAKIRAFTGANWTGSSRPTHLTFETTASGSSGPSERMRIDSSGNVGISNSAPAQKLHVAGKIRFGVNTTYYGEIEHDEGSTGANIYTSQDVGGHIFKEGSTERMRITSGGLMQMGDASNAANGRWAVFISDPGTANQRGRMMFHSKTGTNGVQEVLQIFIGTAEKLRIRAQGDIFNSNNVFSALSDVKLKENIVDAASQWDDIKNLRVRKYNFKEETGHDTHTQIGLVAQEVETVSPGLVTDLADNDTDGKQADTVTKSVNYSVLYMKAVKALQEAQTRIETLETQHATLLARVTALEAA